MRNKRDEKGAIIFVIVVALLIYMVHLLGVEGRDYDYYDTKVLLQQMAQQDCLYGAQR